MAIKKFDAPEPEPTEPKAPSPADIAKDSKFSPWTRKDDPKKRPLGNKVYTAGGGTEGRYSNTEELADALLLKADEGFKKAEELVKLYEKATRSPSRTNVLAYSEAIKEVLKSDPETASAVISILVATLATSFGGGRR
jgi:hypothetical protein